MQLNLNDILGMTGMGGFRAGMSDDRALEMSNRDLRSKDLLNESQSMKNQDFMDEGPLRVAERARKLAEAERLKAEMDSGVWQADRDRQRAIQDQSLTKARTDNENLIQEKRIKGMQAIHTMFGGNTDIPEPMLVSGWEDARRTGKEYGFDIGEFNEQNKRQLVMRLRQTPQMAKLFEEQRKAAEKKETDLLNHQQAIDLERFKAGNAQTLAGINNVSDEKQAATRAGPAPRVGDYKPSDEFEAAFQRLRAGQTDEYTIALAEAFVKKQIFKDAEGSVQVRLLQLQEQAVGETDPEKKKDIQRRINEIYAAKLESSGFGNLWRTIQKAKGAGGKAQKTEVRRKTDKASGKVLIEYSDGSTEVK